MPTKRTSEVFTKPYENWSFNENYLLQVNISQVEYSNKYLE